MHNGYIYLFIVLILLMFILRFLIPILIWLIPIFIVVYIIRSLKNTKTKESSTTYSNDTYESYNQNKENDSVIDVEYKVVDEEDTQ